MWLVLSFVICVIWKVGMHVCLFFCIRPEDFMPEEAVEIVLIVML